VTSVGCIKDVRLDGQWLPMDPSENDDSAAADFSRRSQNIDDGCESNACVGILCDPGLVCVDVWRQADCRCAFLAPRKEVGYAFTRVCLSVCLLDYLKSYGRILMKFVDGWGVAQELID